jgi:hypothetical protein
MEQAIFNYFTLVHEVDSEQCGSKKNTLTLCLSNPPVRSTETIPEVPPQASPWTLKDQSGKHPGSQRPESQTLAP